MLFQYVVPNLFNPYVSGKSSTITDFKICSVSLLLFFFFSGIPATHMLTFLHTCHFWKNPFFLFLNFLMIMIPPISSKTLALVLFALMFLEVCVHFSDDFLSF